MRGPGRPKKDDDNIKSFTLKVRLTKKEYERLKEVAGDRGVSMSSIVVEAINKEHKIYDDNMVKRYFNNNM